LVSIGLVVSEEKIFEEVYDVRTRDAKSSNGLWPGELKKGNNSKMGNGIYLRIAV
jgi:hypothetical protein